jgi:hypothetical protein
MAYQQKTWQSGEVITSAALNNIESGISDLIDHNTKMASNFTSTKLEIGSTESGTLIEGSGGNLKVAKKIEAANLEITTNATFSGSVTVPELTDQNSTSTAAVPKGYVDGLITALQSTQIAVVGDGLTSKGTLGANPNISLNAATTTTLGGIKVGNGLSIDNGTLSTIAISPASDSSNGLMSKENFTKLKNIPENATNNIGTITGIQLHGSTITPSENSDGVVNLGSGLVTGIKLYSGNAIKPPTAAGTTADGTITLRGVVTGITVDNDTIISAPTDAPEGNGEDSGVINISSILSNKLDIPTLPEDDGTYTLQLTLNHGTATYAWVAVSTSGGG